MLYSDFEIDVFHTELLQYDVMYLYINAIVRVFEVVAFYNKNAFVENNINFYADSVERDFVLCDIKTTQQKYQSDVKCGPTNKILNQRNEKFYEEILMPATRPLPPELSHQLWA
ncbi:hypothetical protein GQX74_009271 [Glossina fuscipes]|nr:hypothetical protein GQX74_009271 [Glossina fuscipes]